MDYQKIIDKIYEDLENDRLVQAVMSCLRLARLTEDYFNVAIFLREISSDTKSSANTFLGDTNHLKKELSDHIWKVSFEYWLKERNVSYSVETNKDEPSVYVKSVGEIIADIGQLEKMVIEGTTPQGMTPFDTAYFTDIDNQKKIILRNRIRDLYTIRERIKSRCLCYAISMEKQLQKQQKNQNFVFDAQNYVNLKEKTKTYTISCRKLPNSLILAKRKTILYC